MVIEGDNVFNQGGQSPTSVIPWKMENGEEIKGIKVIS